MKLTGSLQIMSLPDILQWVLHAQKTGCLQVEYKSVTRSIYFREGRVIACAAEDPSVLLGQFLLAHGRISEETLREGLAHQERSGENLGKVLVEMGALRQDQLLHIVASKAMETIHGLFDWERATFTFEPDVEPVDGTMHVDLDINEVLLEGMRRQDEMAQIHQTFTSMELVLERTDLTPSADMIASPIAQRIYDSIDGKKTLAEILLESRASEFMGCQLLLSLHEAGMVAIGGVRHKVVDRGADEPSLELAQQMMDIGDPFAAFQVLRELQDANPSEPMIKQMLARAEAEFITSTYHEGLRPDCVPLVAVPVDEVPEDQLGSSEWHILRKIDGEKTVKSLMWTLPMRPVDVLCALKVLSQRGLIQIPPLAVAAGS